MAQDRGDAELMPPPADASPPADAGPMPAPDGGPIVADAGFTEPDASVRVLLTVARHASSPSGVSTGSPAQFVAAFVFTASANAGGSPAVVEGIGPRIVSSVRTSQFRDVTLWADAIGPEGRVLGRYLVGPGENLDTLTPRWFHTIASGFDVAAGESRTMYVTADTRDAFPGDTLAVDLPEASVTYSDGVTSGIVPASLPISGLTLTY